MRKREILSLITISLIAFFILSAFAFAEGKVTLEWYCWGRPTELEYFRWAAKTYNEQNPNVEVKLTETGWLDHFKVLDIRIAGNDAPDIFRCIYGYTTRYLNAEAAADLTPYIDKDWWGTFWPSLKSFVEKDGKIYGIPQMADTTVTFYNKDYLEVVGARIPDSPKNYWSWSEWEEIGRKVKEQTKADYGFAGWASKTEGYPAYINTYGGSFMTASGELPNIDTPAVREALKQQKRWYDEGLEPTSSILGISESAKDLFSLGKISMTIQTTAMLDWMKESVQDKFNWDITYDPGSLFGNTGYLGGCLNIVANQSKNQKEAYEFLRWLMQDENIEDFCQIGFIPAIENVANTMKYERWNEAMKIAMEQYGQISNAMVQEFKHQNNSGIMQTYADVTSQYYFDQISLDQCMDMLTKEIGDLLKQ